MGHYYRKTEDGHALPLGFSSPATTPSLISKVDIPGIGEVDLKIEVGDILYWSEGPGLPSFWWHKTSGGWRRVNPKNAILDDLQDRPDRPVVRRNTYW
jgi:hypothetical protein